MRLLHDKYKTNLESVLQLGFVRRIIPRLILQCWDGGVSRYFTLIIGISKTFTMEPEKSRSVKQFTVFN